MAHLALGGLGSVLDLGVELRLHPDALVRDPLDVGLGFADQGREALAQLGGGLLVEAVVDLASIDQVIAFAAAEIDPSQSLPSSAKPAMVSVSRWGAGSGSSRSRNTTVVIIHRAGYRRV